MIQLVYELVLEENLFDNILVATEDERIAEVLDSLNIPFCLSSDLHQSGTDRCAEVVEQQNLHDHFIVNVQGDEPLLPKGLLKEFISFMQKESFDISTICTPLDPTDLSNPNVCKVVMSRSKRSLYFSRAPIPWIRNGQEKDKPLKLPLYRHIGVYGFKPGVILNVSKLKPGKLEQAEKLEQLRWLEHDYNIGLYKTNLHFPHGVDTPWDLQVAEQVLKHRDK